jgi:hypothetical protein
MMRVSDLHRPEEFHLELLREGLREQRSHRYRRNVRCAVFAILALAVALAVIIEALHGGAPVSHILP